MNNQANSPLLWKDKIIDYVISHSGALISAVVVIVIGLIAARWVGKLIDRWLERKAMEPPLRTLLVRIVRLFVFALALVIALDTAGLNVTALVAGVSVAGVGVGLAAQGVLGNLVAGLTIIFTKPFRVGEYIELLGVQGQIKQVELFSTTLLHPDQSRVVIPNRKIVGEVLHNYGHVRQLELNVGVAYETDIDRARQVIHGILTANPRVLKEPAPIVGIVDFGDSSVQFTIKPWVDVADFNAARVEICEAILNQFRAQRIQIPFPQREVRLLNEK
jgi:small conductance mechanosensitive channel